MVNNRGGRFGQAVVRSSQKQSEQVIQQQQKRIDSNTRQRKITFKINRSGDTVQLTPKEARDVLAKAQSAFEKGETGVPDRNNVGKAASFLVSESKKRSFIAGKAALEGRIKQSIPFGDERLSEITTDLTLSSAQADVVLAGQKAPTSTSKPTPREEAKQQSLTESERFAPVGASLRDIQTKQSLVRQPVLDTSSQRDIQSVEKGAGFIERAQERGRGRAKAVFEEGKGRVKESVSVVGEKVFGIVPNQSSEVGFGDKVSSFLQEKRFVGIDKSGAVSRSLADEANQLANIPSDIGKSVEKVSTPILTKIEPALRFKFTKSPEETAKGLGKSAEIATFFTPVGFASVAGIGVGGVDKALDRELEAQNRLSGVVEAGLSTAVIGGAAALKVRQISKQPSIIIKEPKVKPETISDTRLLTKIQGEDVTNFAKFSVLTKTPERFGLVVTKGQRFKRTLSPLKFRGKRIDELTIGEGKLLFPKSEVIKIEKATKTLSESEPFIVKGGRVSRPARKGGRVVEIQTIRNIEGRITKRVVSKLEGGIDERASFRIGSKKSIDKNTQRMIKELEQVSKTPKMLITQTLPKKTKLSRGDIKVVDLFGISRKKLKLKPKGRRTSRADVLATQKSIRLDRFDVEFGLKEQELLFEKLAVTDVTFPRFRVPKRVDLIKGNVFREVKEVPSTTSSNIVKDFNPLKKGRTNQRQALSKELDINKQAIKNALGSTAIKNIRLTKSVPTNLLKTTTTKQRAISPRLSSSGLLTQQRTFTSPKIKLDTQSKSESKLLSKVVSSQVPKTQSKLTTKSITKSITKELNKSLTKQAPKQTTKLSPKLITKLTTKNILKTPTLRTPRFQPPKTFKTPPLPPFLLPSFEGRKRKRKKKGFSTRGDIALVEGFTAKALKFKPIKIPSQKIPGFAVQFQTIGTRRRPIVI